MKKMRNFLSKLRPSPLETGEMRARLLAAKERKVELVAVVGYLKAETGSPGAFWVVGWL